MVTLASPWLEHERGVETSCLVSSLDVANVCGSCLPHYETVNELYQEGHACTATKIFNLFCFKIKP